MAFERINTDFVQFDQMYKNEAGSWVDLVNVTGGVCHKFVIVCGLLRLFSALVGELADNAVTVMGAAVPFGFSFIPCQLFKTHTQLHSADIH